MNKFIGCALIWTSLLFVSGTASAEEDSLTGANVRNRHVSVRVNGHWAHHGWLPLYRGAWNWGYYRNNWGVNYRPFGYSYGPYRPFPYYRRLPRYAAISYSPETGRYGASYGKISKGSAVSVAQAYCGAEDCAPVVWARGGCTSIATNDADGVSWGIGNNLYVAESYALDVCRGGQDNGSCRKIVSTCSN